MQEGMVFFWGDEARGGVKSVKNVTSVKLSVLEEPRGLVLRSSDLTLLTTHTKSVKC